MSAQFLVAKYIPDLIRNEPRNIGVIVWSEVGTVARFIGADKYGNFDSNEIPDFIQSKPAFKQWVSFWLSEIKKQTIEFIGTSKVAEKSSPDFVEALQTTGKNSYFLHKGGDVLEVITGQKLQQLADELFRSLVVTEEQPVEELDSTEILEAECETVLKRTKLFNHRNFSKKRTVQCKIASEVEPIEFSYWIGNGAPVWLGQQVPLKKYPVERDRIIDATLWRFEAVIRDGFVSNKDMLGAFVFPTDQQMQDKDVQRRLAILGTHARVLNLRNRGDVQKELDALAEIPVKAD